MTTNVPPRVVFEEYIKEHGPTKVSVLAKQAGIGETTTRKILHLLQGEGKLHPDGSLWGLAGTTAGEVKPKPQPVSGDSPATRRTNALERDNAVVNHLAASGPKTRNEVAEFMGVKPSEAYLSLFRLRKAGLVVKTGEKWAQYLEVKG